MKKIVIHSAGSYDKLKVEEHPGLEITDNKDVIIDVHYFGVNFADVCVRLGVYESAKEYVGWPITPGFEVSGTIKSVGSEVKNFSVGQKVVAFTRFNGYSTEVKIKEKQVLPLPESFKMEEGSAFLAVFFTAYHALYQQVVLHPKSKVLIHSAAGGVGTALVQLCKLAGFLTVGVIGSSHKREYLQQFSPDHIIDKSKENLWETAYKLAPEGYDLILDANGTTTMQDSYNHLAPTGKLLVYGTHSLFSKDKGRLNYLKAAISVLRLPKFNPMDMITHNKGVVGFNISFLFNEDHLIKEMIDNLLELINNNKIKPIPVSVFKFEEVDKAHKLIESGKSVGKIVISCKS